MGNGITKNPCFSSDTYAVALPSDPVPNDNHGHSFTYVPTAAATGRSLTFSLSGAAISANQVTASSMPSFRTVNDMTWPQSSACTFESSRSFAAAPLQASPTRSPMSGRLLSMSGRFSDTSGAASTISNRLSGTLDRSFSSSSSFESHQANASHLMAERGTTRSGRCNERPLSRFFARAASRLQLGAPRYALLSEGPSEAPNMESLGGEDRLAPPNDNVQWAQGMVGEDRFHVAVSESEEHGWVFVGIYDGFNGPDAADYLMANLYVALHRELTTATTVDSPEFARKPAKRGRTERAEKDKAATSGGGTAMHHDEVLGAMAAALRKTEEAFFAASERWADESPELGLMGSCVLVMLMKGADVYVMSVGDSRAVLAARRELDLDIIVGVGGLRCVQLNDEHSTADAKEEMRVRDQHSDDPNAIVRGRVKGKLNLTRAFGAGYLKQPKWNSRLLAAFKIDYIGLEPYISCNPSLRHHRIGPNDKFLVLSSDGLYQYFTNEEVVDHVQMFTAAYPDGDPAQHLVAELLVRAAKKAGMHCHELLEIGHGGRRKYHDDVSIIVISFKGRIWRSSV